MASWEAFFQEVLSFLRRVELDHSSQDHLDFYLERLETIISSTQRISDVLHSTGSDSATINEAGVLQRYQGLTDELLMHLRRIYTHVNSALDNYMSRSIATAYQVTPIGSGQSH